MAWSFSNEATAESVIEQIESGKITNKSTISMILNQIKNDLKGTAVAKTAQDMLDTLLDD